MSDTLLSGDKIRLAALTREDLSAVSEWHHDAEFLRMQSDSPAHPGLWHVDYLEKSLLGDNPKSFPFGVRTASDDVLIGFATIQIQSWAHRSAELGIGIGEAAHRGHGYGREAMTLLTGFCFRELHLHRVEVGVFSYNAPAIALYESMGFKVDGALRENIKRDGQWYDTLVMSILDREWTGSNGSGS